MDQGQLRAAAGCAAIIVAAGAAADIAWPGPTVTLTAADYAVGVAFAGCGAWLAMAARGWAWISMATAAAWFAGAAASAAPWLAQYPGDVAVLSYRAFLLHLLARAVSQQPKAVARFTLFAVGYLAVFLPSPADGLATAAIMAGLAALAARAAARSPADLRRALIATSLSSAALALIWLGASAGITSGAAADLANDLGLAASALVIAAGWAREDWLRGAISSLVVDLGPSRRPAGPVSALLADALADPEIAVLYSAAGLGWFDEHGQPVAAPPAYGADAAKVTRVAAPDGGEVVLVHGLAGAAGQALSVAAARAAALALDSARIGAEVRVRASAVSESRQRLLAVSDAERKALEARLQAGPVGRLRLIDEALSGLDDQAAQVIRGHLAAALDDLARLARGLYPGHLGTRPLEMVLKDLATGMPISVQVIAGGPLGHLPDAYQALAYFFCSECLTNVVRHAQATTATVHVRFDGAKLEMSVRDDGQGGATASGSRGLRGLADRLAVAGGRLTVDSPPGGPTSVRADVPLGSRPEPKPASL
jgi:signal transduction histidine kinase